MAFLATFLITFAWMEWAAWALHKYAMHGPLWNLHEDHHVVDKSKAYQKNDYFALFFAVPSFLSILFGSQWGNIYLLGFGYGVMAYGAVYLVVHEVIIHRRWRWFDGGDHWYFNALKKAHRHHHRITTKDGASNFGMLLVPLKYFAEELKLAKHINKP